MPPRLPMKPPPPPRRPPRVGYLIIEHPTRGTLRYLEFEDFERDGDRYRLVDGRRVPIYKARFSTAANRDDERTERFYSTTAAREALAKIPPRIRAKCKILMQPTGAGEYEWRELQL